MQRRTTALVEVKSARTFWETAHWVNFATYSGQCTSQLARLRFFDLRARRKLSVWCAVRTLDGFLSASAMNSIISGTCVIFGDAYIHQGRNLQKNHSKSCSRTKACTKPSLRRFIRRVFLLRNHVFHATIHWAPSVATFRALKAAIGFRSSYRTLNWITKPDYLAFSVLCECPLLFSWSHAVRLFFSLLCPHEGSDDQHHFLIINSAQVTEFYTAFKLRLSAHNVQPRTLAAWPHSKTIHILWSPSKLWGCTLNSVVKLGLAQFLPPPPHLKKLVGAATSERKFRSCFRRSRRVF